MSKIVLYIATSIDGYIADQEGSVDWLEKYNEENVDYGYFKFYDQIDSVILGRSTYEQVLGFGDWPYSDKTTYLLTNQMFEDSELIKKVATVESCMAMLEEAGHECTWLVGGAVTFKSFLDEGVVDELIITIMPETLGAGTPLYLSTKTANNYKLHSVKEYNEVVQLHYMIKE